MRKTLGILLLAAFVSPGAIAATTITFDELPWGPPELTSYSSGGLDSGVTFTPLGSAVSVFGGPTPTWGTGLTATPTQIQAVIHEGASSVDVQLGSFVLSQLESLYLNAYGRDDALVAWDVHTISSSDPAQGMVDLHVEYSYISRVVLGVTVPAGSDLTPVAIADNFTYAPAVPAPGALLLALSGLGLVQGLRRKSVL